MVENLFPISSFFKIKFMFKRIFYAVLLFISAATSQCSKTTVDPNALPPETQTGAGTFACKINGKIWNFNNPSGFLNNSPITRWSFDPGIRGGNLEILGFTYDAAGTTETSELDLYGDSLIYKSQIISSRTLNHFAMKYYDFNSVKCQGFSSGPLYDTTNNFYSSGKLNISRLDQSAKVISGTFNYTIYQTGCDTLKITDGRFDIKYQ